MIRRAVPLIVLLAGCRGEPPKPPPGTAVRRAEIAVPSLVWADDAPIAGDAAGAHTYLGLASGVVDVDWSAMTTTNHAGTELLGDGPLRRVAAQRDEIEWPGVAPIHVLRASGWTVALAPDATVPLVAQVADRDLVVEGWRSDGTRAWRAELGGRGLEPKELFHLGDLVLVQAVGKHDPVDGWTGLVVALDAATGDERWRSEPKGQDYPAADAALPHGDEVALIYEIHVDVVGRADGERRRRIHLHESWMTIADHVGFDGVVVWSFQHEPPHDNPGDHMWGSSPRPPSPAKCTYLVYDTHHDRGRAIRTEASAVGEAREWLIDCTAHAILPLADGGVQVLVVPQDGTLQSIWFDHPL